MSMRACICALLLSLMLMAGGGEAHAALSTGVVTLVPGTTTVRLGEAVFMVSTDRTISLSLTFVTGDLLDGLIVLRDTSPALVQILWRDTGVIVFAGPVAQVRSVRCRVPVKSLAVEDSGHTEK
jgi:hypothetical protein